MTFKILDRSTPPPGGWRHVEGGHVFEHFARDTFFNAIRDYRLNQGIPIEPGWQEKVEDEICKAHPEWGKSVCGRTERYGERRPVSLAALQSFINVMAKWIAGIVQGREVFVSQDEADSRAAICITCEFNMELAGSCGACADRIARALSIIGSRRTKYDDQLGACGICSCALRVAVHIPLHAQRAGLSEELKEEFRKISYCWKGKDE